MSIISFCLKKIKIGLQGCTDHTKTKTVLACNEYNSEERGKLNLFLQIRFGQLNILHWYFSLKTFFNDILLQNLICILFAK